MRRFALALALLAVSALALGACASGKATGLPEGPESVAASAVCTGTVDMTNGLKFVPDKCTVKANTTVVWKNVGDAPHTVTSVDEKQFDSGLKNLIAGGGQFTFAFKKAGTYPYYCRLHSSDKKTGMVGTVVVE